MNWFKQQRVELLLCCTFLFVEKLDNIWRTTATHTDHLYHLIEQLCGLQSCYSSFVFSLVFILMSSLFSIQLVFQSGFSHFILVCII